MSQTLPSDLYDPVLALEYATYQFYENLSILSKMVGTSSNSPIRLDLSKAKLQSGGAYLHAPVFKPMTTIETRRDLTSTSDATPLAIQSRDDIGVRVSRKLGPVSFTKSASWLANVSKERFTEEITKEAMKRMQLSMRDFIIAIAKGAITNITSSLNTKNVYSATSRTNLSTSLLASIKAVLGDRADVFAPGSGAGWIFRSEPYYTDLVQNQLGAGVQGIADRAAAGYPAHTLGLDFCLADNASLTVAGSPYAEYDTLLLGSGCMEMDLIKLEFEPLWLNPKAENVEFVVRGDYDVEYRVPGFAYDTTNGGSNPSLTTIGTSTNWDPTYTDHREVAMALGRHNYSGN